MFRVNYNKVSEDLDTVDKVMSLIRKINIDKLVNNQLVVIETEDKGVIELGLGMEEKSVVFYIPESEEEDVLVSCNKLVERAKTEAVNVSHVFGDEVECTIGNIVSLDNGLKILEAFLNGEEFIDIVDWYAY